MLYCGKRSGCPPLTDKCIILDLDETLLHTLERADLFTDMKLYTDPKLRKHRIHSYDHKLYDVGGAYEPGKRGAGIPVEIAGFTRPHLDDFLDFCFRYFRVVGVWSAGQKKYVDTMCDHIFRDHRDPHIIYSWDDCEVGRDGVEKPLSKMMNEETELNLRPENTLVLDNTPSTFMKVNPDNGIHIPDYVPVRDGQRADNPTVEEVKTWLNTPDDRLRELMNWLMNPTVIKAKDVRVLDTTNIFS